MRLTKRGSAVRNTDNVRSGPVSWPPTININIPGSTEESRYNHHNVNTGRPRKTADGTRLPQSHMKSYSAWL
jgi:hypothetical protein